MNNSKGFTLIELMITVAILGVLAAVAITGFQGYLYRSKTSEAMMALDKIVNGEVEYFGKNLTFLAAGPTNIPPVAIGPTTVDFGTDPTWAMLGFGITGKVYFGYQVTLPSATSANCDAMADLNGDGIDSLFRRNISATGSTITVANLYVFDELE